MNRLGLDRETREGLTQLAAQMGVPPDALGFEILRIALPAIKAAFIADTAPVSNVVAITSRASPWLGTGTLSGR